MRTLSQTWRATGLIVALAAAGAAMAPAVTFGQDRSVQSLVDRIDRLERDIRTLNLQIARGGSAPLPPSALSSSSPDAGDLSSPAAARMSERLSTLESDLRMLTGRNEEIVHRIDTIERRLDKLVSDIDYRLSALERSGGASAAGPAGLGTSNTAMVEATPGQTTPIEPPARGSPPGTLGTIPRADLERFQETLPEIPPPAASSGPARLEPQVASTGAGLPDGSAEEQYAFARSFLFKHDYTQAEQALSQFLAEHPDHGLAGNARYWLGETYYVRQDYVRAAEVFLEGYQKEPKGGKAPDTLLKLGMALTNLDKPREACAAFDKLRSEFPDASQNILSVETRERQRAGCS